MASVEGADVHTDPNFAVICSFFERYGELVGFPNIAFTDLQRWIEDTRGVTKPLLEIVTRLLRRWKSFQQDKWDKYFVKFAYTFSEIDAWELERFGFPRCKVATKLRLLKHLIECQFDYNTKFKEKINEKPSSELRVLPLGRDRNGLAYWYLLDKELGMYVYREDQDDAESETWQIVVKNRQELSALIHTLEADTHSHTKSRSSSPISTTPSEIGSHSQSATPTRELLELSKLAFKCESSGPPAGSSPANCKCEEGSGSLKQETEAITNKPQNVENDRSVKQEAEAITNKPQNTKEHGNSLKQEEKAIASKPLNVPEDGSLLKQETEAIPSKPLNLKDNGSSVKQEAETVTSKPVNVLEDGSSVKEEAEAITSKPLNVKEDGSSVKQEAESITSKALNVKEDGISVKQETEAIVSKPQNEEAGSSVKQETEAITIQSQNVKGDFKQEAETLTDKPQNVKEEPASTDPVSCKKHLEADVKETKENLETERGDSSEGTDVNAAKRGGSTASLTEIKDTAMEIPLSTKKADESECKTKIDLKEHIVGKLDDIVFGEGKELQTVESYSQKEPDSRESANSFTRDVDCQQHANKAERSDCTDMKTTDEPVHQVTRTEAEEQSRKRKHDMVRKEQESEQVATSQSDSDMATSESPSLGDSDAPPSKKKRDRTRRKVAARRGRVRRHSQACQHEIKEQLANNDEPEKTTVVVDTPDTEDDKVFQPRRSLRANKGQRTFFSGTVETVAARRKRGQTDKETKTKKLEMKKKKERTGRLRKEEEVSKSRKKKKTINDDTDDEFVPGQGGKRPGKRRRRGRHPAQSASDESSESSDDQDLFADEDDESLHWATPQSSENELDSDGSEYQPSGRNAKRQAARKTKSTEETSPKGGEEEFPCSKCGKGDHPELILLCDKCDAGYHTTCLRPPLLLIPDGDWFCPPCEHSMLILSLEERLVDYDLQLKAQERFIKRKQRLDFVGISLSNILPGTGSEYVEDTYDEKKVEKLKEKRQMHIRFEERRRRRQYFQEWNEQDPSSSSTDASETSSSEEDQFLMTRRSKRQRKDISYKFEEYDKLIVDAIQSDDRATTSADGKNIDNLLPEEKVVPKVYKRPAPGGKDIQTIMAAAGCELDDEDKTAEGGRPPPVVKKRRMRGRRLTALSDEEDQEDDDETDEYKASEDSPASGVSAEEEEDYALSEDELDDWRETKRSSHSLRHKSRYSTRRSRPQRYKDFVVEGDESDGEVNFRSSRRRRAARRPVNYHEDDSGSDYSAASSSDSKRKSKESKRKRIVSSDDTESDGDQSDPVTRCKGRTSVRYDDDSDFRPSDTDSEQWGRRKKRTASKNVNYRQVVGSDSEQDTPKRKKKGFDVQNFVKSDSEEEYNSESDSTDTNKQTESAKSHQLSPQSVTTQTVLPLKVNGCHSESDKTNSHRSSAPDMTSPVSVHNGELVRETVDSGDDTDLSEVADLDLVQYVTKE